MWEIFLQGYILSIAGDALKSCMEESCQQYVCMYIYTCVCVCMQMLERCLEIPKIMKNPLFCGTKKPKICLLATLETL
jgi:hypothetical protein